MQKYPDYVSITIDKDRMCSDFYHSVIKTIKRHGLSETTCEILTSLIDTISSMENRDDGFICLTLNDVSEFQDIFEEQDIGDDIRLLLDTPVNVKNSLYYTYAQQIFNEAYDFYKLELRNDLTCGNFVFACHSLQNLMEHFDLALMVFDQKMGNAKDYVNQSQAENDEGELSPYSFEQVNQKAMDFIQRGGLKNASSLNHHLSVVPGIKKP
jgi:hypothetical protein